MAVKLQVQNTGNVFYGYHLTVWISAKYRISTLNNVDMAMECHSTDTGDSGTSYVTFYNIAPSNIQKWKIHDYISLWCGPPSIFGKFFAGNITKITTNPGDGKDSTVTIYFSESANYDALQNPQDNGNKTESVKSGSGKNAKSTKKTVPVKVNHTFPKNVKAKTIINYITNKTHIKIAHFKLKTNRVYKRGYTLSKPPFKALQGLANDCNTLMYFRNNQLIFDDQKADNPFHEHIYYAIGYGLTAQPVQTSQVKQKKQFGKKTKQVITQRLWTLETWLDPRCAAGSYVQVRSKTLNNFCRVKRVDYKFSEDEGYTSEVQCVENV